MSQGFANKRPSKTATDEVLFVKRNLKSTVFFDQIIRP